MSEPHTLKIRIPLGGSAVFIRFYGELNDFLPATRRGRMLIYRFQVAPSIKDAIESFGVPHPEIELMVVNHSPVDFSYRLHNGDYISVFPAFHTIPLNDIPQLRAAGEQPPRFLLDVHLGRLAAYLRLMGFDAVYDPDFEDAQFAGNAAAEGRVVLTRDRLLLKRNEVTHGYWVRHTAPRKQLLEIVGRFDLSPAVNLFSRCLVCNSLLQAVDKDTIAHRLPPRTAQHFQDFHLCPGCDRVYWNGPHYRRMLEFAGRTLRQARSAP